jgi:pimeloyl-ACP methyl ester carboxylesterase
VRPSTRLSITIVSILLAAATARPSEPPPPPPETKDPFATKAETFVKLFLDGARDQLVPMMASEMSSAFTPEAIEDLRQRLAAEHGKVAHVHPAWLEAIPEPYRRYRVPVEGESKIVDLQVVFDTADMVTGFFHTAHVEPPYGAVRQREASAAETKLASDHGGRWSGAIATPGMPLPVAVELTYTSGQWSGTFDSPAQGVTGLPLGEVRVSDEGIVMTLVGAPGNPTFRGKLAGTEITGTFEQGGQSFPFRLGRAELAKPERPQEPAGDRSYREEEVRFEGKAGVLAGTLTLPPGGGPFPAVLLLSGSGAQNRDEEILGHKPFLVLADHLARAGVASLRVDDRGVGGSAGDLSRSTSADLAADALAGVRLLAARPEIDRSRVGLIGHSDGGVVAPLAAARSDDVAFVVMLAGSGVPGRELLVHQLTLILRSGGVPQERIERSEVEQRKLLDMILAGAERDALESQVRRLTEAQGGSLPAAAAAEMVGQLTSPWFRDFLTHDPRPSLRQLDVPVLALIGELDLQVAADQNLPEIRKALAEAGTDDVTVLELPGLNHLFQSAKSGAVSEYGSIEETMSPRALELVSGWILERFGPGRAKAAKS